MKLSNLFDIIILFFDPFQSKSSHFIEIIMEKFFNINANPANQSFLKDKLIHFPRLQLFWPDKPYHS